MTQQSSTFSHICRLVPSDPPWHSTNAAYADVGCFRLVVKSLSKRVLASVWLCLIFCLKGSNMPRLIFILGTIFV